MEVRPRTTFRRTPWCRRVGTLEIDLGEPTFFDRVLLQEPICLGQRVSAFRVEARVDGEWMEVARATTIGYKRVLRIDGVTADWVRVVIEDANNVPALSTIALYEAWADEG